MTFCARFEVVRLFAENLGTGNLSRLEHAMALNNNNLGILKAIHARVGDLKKPTS